VIVESYEDVIVLSGALRSNFWETIHTAISLMLRRHPTGVIIDCSGITEVTPQGADTFVDIMRFIEEHDARIIVAAVPPHAMDVLRSVPEVRSQLAVARSVEEARKSLDLLVEPEKRRKQEVIARSSHKLLVVLLGGKTDQDALELGSEIADTLEAEIHIVFVVTVPRDLPIQAPMPQQEAMAAESIENAKAYLTSRKVARTARLERARDVAQAINDVLAEVPATQVVVPLSPEENDVDDMAKLVKNVLTRVPATVIFVRGGLK
jgi:anti-anti-sigma regulatory factor